LGFVCARKPAENIWRGSTGGGHSLRELTGERIRDKFAASRRKGMWMERPELAARLAVWK
jgi:hypothetical protein